MGSASNYLENEILDHILKVGAYSVPSNIYVALSTADPTESGGSIAEPSGNNYSRVACNTWDAASGGATANTSTITFPTPSGSWGTVTHFALYDASSAGNMLFYGALSASKNIGAGDTPSFAAGALDITCD
jgi:hypothetical protein